ncbi:MAG TPA: hypothetical protein VGF33_10035 [Caulobacteraceae bacterium]|jgi:hypothetical protein
MTIWTRELTDACGAVARDETDLPFRNMADVRSRAREFWRYQRIGEAMTAHHLEYFACLYQRLETSDRFGLDSHRRLQAAWNAAQVTA